MIDPMGNTVQQPTDSAGRPLAVILPLGQTTRYQYDAISNLLQITDPLNGVTSLSYDPNGNLLSLTDARRGLASTYTYNNMDRLASRTDPLTRSESYQYDPVGNLTLFTDRRNQATSYTYDALNRPTQVSFNGQSTISYTWDAGNRLTQISDSLAGTITRTYDDLDRLLSETTPQGSVSYTYDSAGRRLTMSVSGQQTISYSYDNNDRLTQITQGTAMVLLAYDAAGRRTSLTLPNGVVVSYGYDGASRSTSMTWTKGSTTLGNLTYSYDANGRRTQMGGSFAQVNLPTALASATYNAGNQLTQWATSILTYDLNGNLSSDGTSSYSWDSRDQLSSISGGVSASFQYDGVGRRVRNAAGKNFLYDRVNAVQELSGQTATASLLTGPGIDEVFTRTDSGGTWTFLADAVGSTLALTDSAGSVQTQYSYEPFGKMTWTGVTSENTFQYTGRENDGTGLLYYRARYYSPTLQRFISEDPIGFNSGSLNFYSYVENNPVSLWDALGLSSLVFNRQNGTLTVIDKGGNEVGTYPAANNAQTGSRGPWAPGDYRYSGHTTHPDDAPDSRFGSNGNFVFKVPGCTGCGVHSGRANVPDKRKRKGPQHATDGCIRTTDDATAKMNWLNSHGDPLKTLTVK